MPCDYSIDVERRLVLSRGWGDLTGEDLMTHQAQLAADPRHDPTFLQLMDFTAVSTMKQVSSGAIKKVSQRHLFGPGSTRAIVMEGSAGYGLARMFETYRQLAGAQERIKVFDEWPAALAWLEDASSRD